ncbi:MAG: gamma carbonic anhydrase family protein [Elusimicrobiaceae bacterium]|nr:gamma carbonic anhydrase family protein [Elusimicrobiaceae bacterium]MBP5616985.1 gamma carbonic anhydrase family protein [Elusimicrobiaceae bacterium]
MIEKLAHLTPVVPSSCFVHSAASIIGQVTLGENVSVFPGAVLRGDIAAITVGKNSNIQDNACLHVNYNTPCEIGCAVSIGHGAVVHGSKIGDNVLVGMNAVIMESEVGPNCIIGAGAVIPAGRRIPAGSLVMGVPGKIVRSLEEEEANAILDNAREYVRAIAIYKKQLKKL